MKQKREVISVWPINHECNIRGLVKITFGESISIFPLKLIEGKHGYYLSFPRIRQENGTIQSAGRFLYRKANRLLTEDVLRTYLPEVSLCREFQMKEVCYHPDVYEQLPTEGATFGKRDVPGYQECGADGGKRDGGHERPKANE